MGHGQYPNLEMDMVTILVNFWYISFKKWYLNHWGLLQLLFESLAIGMESIISLCAKSLSINVQSMGV